MCKKGIKPQLKPSFELKQIVCVKKALDRSSPPYPCIMGNTGKVRSVTIKYNRQINNP